MKYSLSEAEKNKIIANFFAEEYSDGEDFCPCCEKSLKLLALTHEFIWHPANEF